MPTGTPYNSFALPCCIRVDDFATPATQESAPALHLLTHTHSDHINGLSAKSFGYPVYCSQDAKDMLLRHEVYAERELHHLKLRAEKTRTYSHLKIGPLLHPGGAEYYRGSRDLLKPLSLHTPTIIELSDKEYVTITTFDANHCPGAVMFLIEGDQGAVLHTGDFRAEPWFLESITHNPLLQPYLASSDPLLPSGTLKGFNPPVVKTLEAIYLDTASVLSTLAVPTKDRATADLVGLMELFPETVYFFINAWTWGYEDILKAIARTFHCQIHVDRYKHSIYHHISDPFLRAVTTSDESSTRFHACERFHRCPYVAVDDEPGIPRNTISYMGKRVVYVNPVTMGSASWDLYLRDTRERLRNGEVIDNLLVPLSRHSPLPELQAFVKLFRPRRVIPNTLDPRLRGLDWASMDRMFADCLLPSSKGYEHPAMAADLPQPGQLLKDVGYDEDVALRNLVGDDAVRLAERWAESGKLRKKLEIVMGYLGHAGNTTVGLEQGASNQVQISGKAIRLDERGIDKALIQRVESDDDTDSDSSDDERGKTAHRLFAGLAGIEDQAAKWWISPSPSQTTGSDLETCVLGRTTNSSSSASGLAADTNARNVNRLTPISSPIGPLPRKQSSHQDQVYRGFDSLSPHTPFRPAPRLAAMHSSLASPIRISQAQPHSRRGLRTSEQGAIAVISSSSRLQPSGLPDPVTPPLSEVHNRRPSRRSVLLTSGSDTARMRKRKLCYSRDENVASNLPRIFSEDAAMLDIPSPSRKPSEHLKHPRPSWRRGGTKPKTSASSPVDNYTLEVSGSGMSRERSRRQERLNVRTQRLQIAEGLARVRPDLVVPSYREKRATLLARHTVSQTRHNIHHSPISAADPLLSFETVDDGDGGMDWNRSRELAEALRDDIANGRRPMLPLLLCAESQ